MHGQRAGASERSPSVAAGSNAKTRRWRVAWDPRTCTTSRRVAPCQPCGARCASLGSTRPRPVWELLVWIGVRDAARARATLVDAVSAAGVRAANRYHAGSHGPTRSRSRRHAGPRRTHNRTLVARPARHGMATDKGAPRTLGSSGTGVLDVPGVSFATQPSSIDLLPTDPAASGPTKLLMPSARLPAHPATRTHRATRVGLRGCKPQPPSPAGLPRSRARVVPAGGGRDRSLVAQPTSPSGTARALHTPARAVWSAAPLRDTTRHARP
jgi:hypothetical protein